MAGSWKYEGDWANSSDEEGDEQAFDQAPAPEDLEAEPDDECEEADPNWEGIIRDESPSPFGESHLPPHVSFAERQSLRGARSW